ncbi:MAG: ABC transporter permease [Candidatus Bathyarchaeia archaeon]
MGLRSYIIKRVVYSIILLLIVIAVNFAIFMLMPGDPGAFLMSAWSKESPEKRKEHEQALNEMWGLTDPWYVRLIKYYRNLLTWNFGIEIAGRRPIAMVMSQKIPYTVLLLGLSTVVSIILGVYLGIIVIKRRGSTFDSAVVVSSLILGSLPTFWIGLVLLWIFSKGGVLGWFPGARAYPVEWALTGWPIVYSITPEYRPGMLTYNTTLSLQGSLDLLGGYLSHLALPFLTLTIFSVGGWVLLTRAAMLETITEDYITTARAKGLDETAILYKHALKNASLPIITSAALSFGFILSGAIITETVFSYPGVGGWTWDAISIRDYSVLMAIFYLISICVIVANVIADLLYGVIDPRIKYG